LSKTNLTNWVTD